MRRFELHRDEDETGISGTGVVVEGIEFSDGRVAMRWMVGDHRSLVTWDSIEAVRAIHGHGGRTRLVWVDEDLERCSAEKETPSKTIRCERRPHSDGVHGARYLSGTMSWRDPEKKTSENLDLGPDRCKSTHWIYVQCVRHDEGHAGKHWDNEGHEWKDAE